ncbi:hypothetical protein [Sulfuriferula multivorans]|uniref:hypothetical protein n=1 Tax=Sulfuriferula multivorans TaxID=1559896 RepID=UPI000F5C1597|nr:hypothetical protein [Sulfuriferula multivorans]
MDIKKTAILIIVASAALISCSKTADHQPKNEDSKAVHAKQILEDITRFENAYNAADVNAISNELNAVLNKPIASDIALPDKALKIASRVRAIEKTLGKFKPETPEVMDIHLNALESLNKIAIIHDRLAGLLASMNSDLAQANSILRLDKDEISNHRNQLINIRQDLSRLETDLHNNMEDLKSATIVFDATFSQIAYLTKQQQQNISAAELPTNND